MEKRIWKTQLDNDAQQARADVTGGMKGRRTLGCVAALGIVFGIAGCSAATDGPRAGPGASSSETEQVASAAFASGSFEEAARIYERAIEKDPKSSSAYLGLASAYLEMGQLSRAEFALNRARDLDGRNPEVLNELGNLNLRRFQPEKAIGFFDDALRRDRHNLSAFTGKAVSLDFLSRHTEAQAVYRQALAVYPTNFVLLSNYALSQALSGQIGAGLAIMEELLRDPDQGETVRSNMAIAYSLAGRPRDARTMLEGTMGGAELEKTLARYAKIHDNYLAGKPIGYLLFN